MRAHIGVFLGTVLPAERREPNRFMDILQHRNSGSGIDRVCGSDLQVEEEMIINFIIFFKSISHNHKYLFPHSYWYSLLLHMVEKL